MSLASGAGSGEWGRGLSARGGGGRLLDWAAMSTFTREDVIRVAELARLELSDDEAERMSAELGLILDHVEALQALDTEGIVPTAHAIPLATPMRADVPEPGIDPDRALANAPRREGDAFAVPKVLEDDG